MKEFWTRAVLAGAMMAVCAVIWFLLVRVFLLEVPIAFFVMVVICVAYWVFYWLVDALIDYWGGN